MEQLKALSGINKPVKDSENNRSVLDDKVYCLFESLFLKAKEERKKYEGNWEKFIKYYNFDQWDPKPPKIRSTPVINIIYPTIETTIPILTDTSPGFDVIAKNPNDFDFAETLSSLIQDWWNNNGMDTTLTECIKDSMVLGTGIYKIVWDDELENGAGDVACKIVDPFKLWVNPGATNFDSCDYVIEAYSKSYGELKRMFPDADIESKSERQSEFSTEDKNKDVHKETLVSPIDHKSTVKNYSKLDSNAIDYNESIEVMELWIKDQTIEEFELETGEKISKLKYPTGRLITVIPSQKLVLQDVENPYKRHYNPYGKIIDNARARKFYGKGEVEPLIYVQDLLNKTTQIIVDHSNLVINSCWIVDEESGVDPEQLTNQIGLIITKKRGTEVRRDPPPPIPSQLFDMYQMFQSLADQQSGINDVTQGRKPTGITAAEALQTMQDAAQTRIRLKERHLNCSLSRMGQLIIARMLQFYKTPRVIKVNGGESQWSDYFEFYIEENNGSYEMKKKTYKFDDEERRYFTSDPYRSLGSSEGVFSIEVRGGTSLPFLKEKRGTLALNLFDRKVIDDQELLSQLDYPKKEAVLQRMQKERDEMVRQQEFMQQQGGQVEGQG